MSADLLAELDIALIRARNPGPLTLDGTNSWVVGREPAWVVDPGPALEAHLDAVAAEVAARGGAGGIAVTHSHGDHADGAAGLRERLGDAVELGRADGRGGLAAGDWFGPLRVLALPGHARDHIGFVWTAAAGSACFTGDAVLGRGSVFVSADMAAYLEALRLLRELAPRVLCPGHGPVVTDAVAHLDGYVAHRLEREQRLLSALDRGLRDEDDLLAAAWPDAPPALREAARVTLRAHLEKLRAEGRLPAAATGLL